MQQQFPLLASQYVLTCPVLTCPVPAAADRPGVPVYLDLDRFAHGAYQVQEPALFLIRTDGHIGFRSTADDFSPLLEYCTRVFLSPPGSPS